MSWAPITVGLAYRASHPVAPQAGFSNADVVSELTGASVTFSLIDPDDNSTVLTQSMVVDAPNRTVSVVIPGSGGNDTGLLTAGKRYTVQMHTTLSGNTYPLRRRGEPNTIAAVAPTAPTAGGH